MNRCSYCEKEFPLDDLTIMGMAKGAGWILKCRECYGDPTLSVKYINVSVTETQKTPPAARRKIRARQPVIEEPEMAQVSCDDPIVEAVVKKLRDRSRVGLAKYGTKLDRTDLTALQWMQHLQEELMDAANYIERLMHDYQQASVIFEAIHKLNKPKK